MKQYCFLAEDCAAACSGEVPKVQLAETKNWLGNEQTFCVLLRLTIAHLLHATLVVAMPNGTGLFSVGPMTVQKMKRR
ncbi:unnamed protein product [Urochloa humidicola]